MQTTTQETLEFDIVIVGAGPSGLASAIRLAQLAKTTQRQLDICIIEKGAEVGAHILSGAVLEPRALDELLPNWRELNSPITTPATSDAFYYLTEQHSVRLPTPPQMRNHHNYIVSLSQVCRWLARLAEELGVQIFPSFAATKLLYNAQGEVTGIATGDQGLDKHGKPKANFQPGINIRSKYYTVLAEGCRGSISQQLMTKFNLRSSCAPQTYGLGIKELWEIPAEQHQAGKVIHTIGWPLANDCYGGSFIYHLQPNYLALGLVVGLDYNNPYLNPFAELQRFKHHPLIKPLLVNGKRLAYGARSINEGGWQSIPKLVFPGGILIGCGAGFLNVPKIKGTHTAMKSGMLAAEAMFNAIQQNPAAPEKVLTAYEQSIRASWIYEELYRARNIRPVFRYGLWPGMLNAAIDTYLLRGKAPWTFTHHADHQQLKLANNCKAISYPKPDNKISFDILSSVNLANTYHEEDQPVHLRLAKPNVTIDINLKLYDAPEQRYCPAQVYEIINLATNVSQPKLQINAANCIHCKACDIKDPTQNITWVPPEGGGGPNYTNM